MGVIMKKKKEPFTIIVGGDMDEDFEDLFSGKNIDQPKNSLYLDSVEQLLDLLSPKKLSTLKFLIEYQSEKNPKSISQIAKENNRFQEALSKDIKHLEKNGFVTLTKDKQKVYASAKHSEIIIRIK
jgi:predicted transcriptional regulator